MSNQKQLIMKKNKILISIFIMLFGIFAFNACEEDNSDNNDTDQLENNLIGTWKYESANDSYWYQFEFNADSTGQRTDAEDQVDNFTYTFTKTEIDFSGGIERTVEYSIVDDTQLLMFGDTLIKQ